jgi:hypothetical protein
MSLINIDFEKVRSMEPSGILQAMVDGLAEQVADPRFQLKMSSFGEGTQELCFGCAATSAIAHLGGKLYSETVKEFGRGRGVSSAFRYSFMAKRQAPGLTGDLLELESAIDSARMGNLHPLFVFCGLEYSEELSDLFDGDFRLETNTWQEQIPAVEATIAALKEAGC